MVPSTCVRNPWTGGSPGFEPVRWSLRYNDDREIDEIRAAQIFHFWITENLGIDGRADRTRRSRYRKRASVGERLSAVIGILETGNRNRIESKTRGVVCTDHNVPTRTVNRN